MNRIKNISALFVFVVTLWSCGPAAEDRKKMHERASVFQDSIANVIRTTIAEAEGPAPVAAPVIDTTGKAPLNIPAK